MRRIPLLLAAASILLVTSPATAAVQFTATATTSSGRPLHAVTVGDLVTVDIRVSSMGDPAVAGLGAAVFGYDGGIVDFISGRAVRSVLHDVCFAPPLDACFNGLDNQIADGLSEGSVVSGPYVQIFSGVSFTPRTGTGAQDPGLDGVVGGGDAQFRVTFAVSGPGFTTIRIGTNRADPILGNAVIYSGGVVADATNAIIEVTVACPEPGTALLIGLGLMGLAATGRGGRRAQASSRVAGADRAAQRKNEKGPKQLAASGLFDF